MELKYCYEQLYDSMVDQQIKYSYCEKFKNVESGPCVRSFTTIVGDRYNDNPRFRFMLVGRAVNGWEEYRSYGNGTEISKERFVDSSLLNFENNQITYNNSPKKRFEWIGDAPESGVAPWNCPRPRIDENPGTYNLSRPIWNYTTEVWCNLADVSQQNAWKEEWYRNIAWTNLYRIAPQKSGNPPSRLKDQQFKACANLLLTEIKLLKPTHILFVTGYNDWFDRFADYCFGGMVNRVQNAQNVEAYGTLENGCKFVVASRPEMKIKKPYTLEVTEKFISLFPKADQK